MMPEERITAGLSIDKALAAFRERVNQPGMLRATDPWLLLNLDHIQQLLSEPLTREEAQALLDVVHKRRWMEELSSTDIHIDGGFRGPILVMLTADYYSHDHQQLLLPQGTRLIGEVQSVNSGQQRKLIAVFHRAICPDGFSISLGNFTGLDRLGTTGLATKANNHHFSTFAAAAAIGGLGGLAQIGNGGIGVLGGDPGVLIRNGVTTQTGQEAEQILNRFLNRLPVITLKEGSRARIYIGHDILVPAYSDHRVAPNL